MTLLVLLVPTLTRKESAMNGKATIDDMIKTLREDKVVRIVGFGKFEIKERAGRTGYNPATGEHIDIPAKNAVTFKPYRSFKEEIADI